MFDRLISEKSSSGYEFNTPMNNSFDLFQPKSQASMFDICFDSNGAGLDRDQFRKFINFGNYPVFIQIVISEKLFPSTFNG